MALEIPTPIRCIAYKEDASAYIVYRYKMDDGTYLDIDAFAADNANNTKAFLTAEYVRNLIGLGGHY